MQKRFAAHPQSAPGDFYVVNGECLACGAPHAVAPNLIGWAVNSEYAHCIWKRQPESSAETEDALAAIGASEIGCHRYAGVDQRIIERLDPDQCDAVAPQSSLRRPSGNSREFRLSLIEQPHSHWIKFAIAVLVCILVLILAAMVIR